MSQSSFHSVDPVSFTSLYRTAHYIGGHWHESGNGTVLHVRDKYHNRILGEPLFATDAQIELAILAAEKGFSRYREWSAGQRSKALLTLHDLLAEQQEAFANLIVAEAGKPISYARGEVARALNTLHFAASEALRVSGEEIIVDYGPGEGKQAYTRRAPVGPILCITPFNFPLNLVLHKVAPALAIGASVIVKPALQTPLTALALARLVEQVGLPPGVFNVVICENELAEKLVTDSRLKMLSFTGSDKVGWMLKSKSGRKKVALELGGNAAVIVDSSADVKKAARQVARGAYLYAGQICISTQRIFALPAVRERFQELLLKEIAQLKAGDPFDPETSVGPLIEAKHFHRIQAWVNEATAGGAQVLTGARAIDPDKNLYAPTLLTHTQPDMKVACEEVFGPVALIERVPDFESALARVNEAKYGLQAGIFTDSLAHVKQAHEILEVGAVIINHIPGFRVDSMPYGGVKGSGLGREGVRYAMEEMSEPRLLVY